MGSFRRSANDRLHAARDLLALWQTPVALTMQREAAILAANAILVSRGQQPDDSPTPHAVFDRLQRLLGDEGIAFPPEYERARPLLLSANTGEWDRLPGSEVARRGEDLAAIVRWLTDLIDPRSPEELRGLSIKRISIAALALVAVLLAVGAWIYVPRNLALDAHVDATLPAYGSTLAGAVDGNTRAAFDYHSSDTDEPWLVIDLGRPRQIHRVAVFGRGDCCFDQSIPLMLLVSDDGITYRKVGERLEPFSRENPWEHSGVGRARFVKLVLERHGVLVVSEVEVYGR
jgi:hypothetical protein